MQEVLLVIQLFIALALIGVVLLQRGGSGALGGLGGAGGGGGSILSGRASANILTKTTGILAFLFMVNSLALGNLAFRASSTNSIADDISQQVGKSVAGESAVEEGASDPAQGGAVSVPKAQ